MDYSNTSNPFSNNTYYSTPITSARESNLDDMHVSLDLPYWGYKDFINERSAWQKGIRTMYDEPAWFYFKIFFKFDTSFGLLGGVYDSSTIGKEGIPGLGINTINTAMKYLITLYNDKKYKNYIYGRLTALYKFICTLSYISTNAPWFFNSIHDVNNALTLDFNNIVNDKSIIIDCNQDSVDMKLMTMMDYYKFACFDFVNQREIIPENLRKFDMDIVVFQSPLRYLHTSSITLEGKKSNYKNMYDISKNYNNLMSFKLFTFKNCEFDYKSLNNMLPSEFNNSTGFSSKPTITIKYDKVYQNTSNEFAQTFMGDAGIIIANDRIEKKINDTVKNVKPTINIEGGNSTSSDYIGSTNSNTSKFTKIENELFQDTFNEATITANPNEDTGNSNIRINQLKYMHDHPNYYNINSNVYKSLVEATEAQVTNYMKLVDGSTGLGNIYGDNKSLSHAIKNTAKNLGQSVYSQVKKTGQSFVDRWKF